MNDFIKRLQEKDVPILFTSKDLKKLFFDKDELEYLLKESLRNKSVYNIYKDIYTLARMYRRSLLSEGVLAQMIVPRSYVSTLYVLSMVNWIPEAVYTVSSITDGDSIRYNFENFGSFRYDKLYIKVPTAGVYFKEDDNGKYRTATPLRAICDYMYMFNKNWDGAEDIHIELRIHYDDLEELKKEDFDILHNKFGIENIEKFLIGLRRDLRI